MSIKPYKLGVIVGRFQLPHKGHEDMINRGAAICDTLCVFVGSSQESGTAKNPFSFEYRKKMLSLVAPSNTVILPLSDAGIGNNPRWGSFVLRKAEEHFGFCPDLAITGKETRRVSWYDDDDIAVLTIPKAIDISASVLREKLLCGNLDFCRQYISPAILEDASYMKKVLNEVSLIEQTDSI